MAVSSVSTARSAHSRIPILASRRVETESPTAPPESPGAEQSALRRRACVWPPSVRFATVVRARGPGERSLAADQQGQLEGGNARQIFRDKTFSLFDRRRDVVRGSARRQRSSSRQTFFARRQQRYRSACASASPRGCLLPAFRSNRAGLLQQRRGACCAVLGYCRQNRSLN